MPFLARSGAVRTLEALFNQNESFIMPKEEEAADGLHGTALALLV